MSEQINSHHVLVTRPEHQAEKLAVLIEQHGWNAIRFPTLKITALDNTKIRQKFKSLEQFDWLIFISANAVNFALRANDGKIERFKCVSIAAVGKATENALVSAGISVDLIPDKDFNSDGLLATLEMQQIAGKSCLILRGQGGLGKLASTLRSRGAEVEYLELYSRTKPDEMLLNEKVPDIEQIDVITVTSGEGLVNLLEMVAPEWHDKLLSIPLVVIGNRIKIIAKEIGFKQIAVTENPGDTAIIESVAKCLGRGMTDSGSTINYGGYSG